MKRVALSLGAIGVLCLAGDEALAEPAVVHSGATVVTVGHRAHRASHVGTVRHYRRPGHYGYGHHPYYRPRHPGGRIHVGPHVWHRHPGFVPPYRYYRPYAHPYYAPYHGFHYYGPRLSIGLAF